jgi:polyketide cyclase/dehydrase/lipid transport protein
MKWLLLVIVIIAVPLLLIVIVGALLPKGHVVSRTASYRQPPDAVWAVITGPPDWRPDIRSYQELPAQNGMRIWRETDNYGQTITYEGSEESVREDLGTAHRFRTRIMDKDLPFGGTWTIDVAPQASGSSVMITEQGEVYNPVFRFVSRFVMGQSATVDAYLKALQKKLG